MLKQSFLLDKDKIKIQVSKKNITHHSSYYGIIVRLTKICNTHTSNFNSNYSSFINITLYMCFNRLSIGLLKTCGLSFYFSNIIPQLFRKLFDERYDIFLQVQLHILSDKLLSSYH